MDNDKNKKQIPEHLVKLDNLKTTEDFLSLIKKIPSLPADEAGFSRHLCKQYAREHYLEFNSREMEQVLKYPDIFKNRKSVLDWFDKHLFEDTQISDNMLKQICLLGDSGDSKNVMIGLTRYFDLAYKNNDFKQMELLADYNTEAMTGTIRKLLESGKIAEKQDFVDLLLGKTPKFVLLKQKEFSEDVVVNFLERNPQFYLDDSYSEYGFMHKKIFNGMIDYRVNHFVKLVNNMAPDTDSFFIKSLWSLGGDFYNAVSEKVDIKSYLSGEVSLDLKGTVDRYDTETGDKFLSSNFFTREIVLNRHQYMFLTEAATDKVFELADIFKEHFDLFNMPVIEKINGIDFKLNPLELAFKTDSMSCVFDYFTRSTDKLSYHQEQIFASVFIKNMLLSEYSDNNNGIMNQIEDDLFKNIKKDSWGMYLEAFQRLSSVDEWKNAGDVEKRLNKAFLNYNLPEKDGKKNTHKI